MLLIKHFRSKLCWTYNIKTFNTIEEEIHVYNTKCNEKINIEVSLNIVMNKNLIKIVEMQKFISSNHMINIKEFATKK